MAIVIEDATVLQEVGRPAAQLHVSPLQAIESAVREKAARESADEVVDEATYQRHMKAIRDGQEWFRLHGSKDMRAPDEMIAYNGSGFLTDGC